MRCYIFFKWKDSDYDNQNPLQYNPIFFFLRKKTKELSPSKNFLIRENKLHIRLGCKDRDYVINFLCLAQTLITSTSSSFYGSLSLQSLSISLNGIWDFFFFWFFVQSLCIDWCILKIWCLQVSVGEDSEYSCLYIYIYKVHLESVSISLFLLRWTPEFL